MISTIYRTLKRKWALFALVAAVPLVLQTNAAQSGPGNDAAVADNRAAMCSLPPFLNVAITEKPNIMVVYDNATSMALPAYTRPYAPAQHYHGLFDPDACYLSNGREFSKASPYPYDTVLDTDGIWIANPEIKPGSNQNADSKLMHERGEDGAGVLPAHSCLPGRFSGNFLNWATMRRIDLLRKAFTGGVGSNSASQAPIGWIGAEGVQTGNPGPFAPCFTKSYSGDGVSPFGVNQVMVVNGRVVWNSQCPASQEVITAQRGAPKRPDTMFAAASNETVIDRNYFVTDEPDSHQSFTKPKPGVVRPIGETLASARIEGAAPYAPQAWVDMMARFSTTTKPAPAAPAVAAAPAKPRKLVQLASLFNVMSDVGLALVGGVPEVDLGPTITLTKTSPAPSSTTAGDFGDPFTVTFTARNFATGAANKGTSIVVSLLFDWSGETRTVTISNANCNYQGLGALNGTTNAWPADGATAAYKTFTCSGNLPTFSVTPTQPKVTLSVFMEGSAASADSQGYNNDGADITPQFTLSQPIRPDLYVWFSSYDLKAGMTGMPFNVVYTVYNYYYATANAVGPISIRLRMNGSTGPIATPTAPCEVPATTTIQPGWTTQITCSYTIPAGLPEGAYASLYATIDPDNAVVELNDSNNNSSWGSAIWMHKVNVATSQKGVDILVNRITVAGGATIGVPGATYMVNIELVNVGARAFLDSIVENVSLVLSRDSSYTTGDMQVNTPGSVCRVPNLTVFPDPGYRRTISCEIMIPSSITAWQYTTSNLAAIALGNLLTPVETDNYAPNTAGTPFRIEYGPPVLRISNVYPYPSSNLSAGLTFWTYVIVNNLGSQTTFTGVRFYWSTDSVLDTTTDTLLPTASWDCINPLTVAGGGYAYAWCSITVPLGTPDGAYNLFAWVDPNRTAVPAEQPQPAEWYNNTGRASVVVGAAAALPNLQIANMELPAETFPGQTVVVSFDVRYDNPTWVSVQPAVRVTFEGVGGSTTNTCTTSRAIWPYEWFKMTCEVVVPGTTGVPSVVAGDSYNIRVKADPNNVIAESSENDNEMLLKILVSPLSTCTANCDNVLKINYDNRGRVGILWSFRAKATGTLAPANLGVTTYDDWIKDPAIVSGDPWKQDGTGFAGVDQNQQQSNNIVPHLEQAVPNGKGKISRLLLNTVKYYGHVGNFQKQAGQGAGVDPMKYDPTGASEDHKCRKNYILLISDGYSYDDWDGLQPISGVLSASYSDLRSYQRDYTDPTAQSMLTSMLDTEMYSVIVPKQPTQAVPQGGLTTEYNGSYHIDNVARYGHAEDIRTDLSGKQTVSTVVVHTFASSDVSARQAARATSIMKTTAIQGSYVEYDNVPGPNLRNEWDADFDGVPDAYFAASEDKDVGEVILTALNSILLKTASGTSVSVIASTTRGEGAIYQSYFRPTTAEGTSEVTWLGFLQALWVDRYGNLREDSDYNAAMPQGLSMVNDYIIKTEFNATSKETLAIRWQDTDGDGSPNLRIDANPIPLTQLRPVFEAGKTLWATDQSLRNIYTWPHPPEEAVPSTAFQPLPFTDTSVPVLKTYLWPMGNTYYNEATATTNVVRWIRGSTIPDPTYRNKRLTIDGTTSEWKLGDIVYSTPSIVGAPEERYDVVYGTKAQGYFEYFSSMRDRRRIVLIGGNDGMLHAFNGGVFKDGDNPATPDTEAAWFDPQGSQIGTELWGYIPGSLLQNLRMLADAGYDTTCHIYYVDLKPKVTDVQIFFDAGTGLPLAGHPDGWGTIVLGGMRLGCGAKEFSSYFILDITDPANPELLAEFGQKSVTSDGSSLTSRGPAENGLSKLNFTYFYPVVMRINDDTMTPVRKRSNGDPLTNGNPGRWYMVTGSGPEELRYNSTVANAAVYVFDLTKLGERSGSNIHTAPSLARHLEDFTHAITVFDGNAGLPLPARTVVSNGLTADLDGDYNVDTAYFTTQIDTTGVGKRLWGSEIWRLNTKDVTASPKDWVLTKVFTTGTARRQAAVAAPGVTRDLQGNIWLYFGTGRFLYKRISITDTDVDDLEYGNPTNPFDTTYQQALYGVIDPCWHGGPTYYRNAAQTCPTSALPLTPANLVNSTSLTTTYQSGSITVTGAQCNSTGGTTCLVSELSEWARSGVNNGPGTGKFGWVINMGTRQSTSLPVWEMSYSKPAVAGGLVLFTTYLPGYSSSDEGCALSGNSYLWAVDYQTGAASEADPFALLDTGSTVSQTVQRKGAIGQEPPSPPAIFGKSVFVQGSNANITRIQTQATFRIKPHVRSWQEQ